MRTILFESIRPVCARRNSRRSSVFQRVFVHQSHRWAKVPIAPEWQNSWPIKILQQQIRHLDTKPWCGCDWPLERHYLPGAFSLRLHPRLVEPRTLVPNRKESSCRCKQITAIKAKQCQLLSAPFVIPSKHCTKQLKIRKLVWTAANILHIFLHLLAESAFLIGSFIARMPLVRLFLFFAIARGSDALGCVERLDNNNCNQPASDRRHLMLRILYFTGYIQQSKQCSCARAHTPVDE